MLLSLNVKNFVLIEDAEITFGQGLNVISGETGAGKSILLSAIGLLLGSRAQSDSVRAGCTEAIVEGLFSVSDKPWLGERLRKVGISEDQNELLIKRVVSSTGRHRVYINGELATLAMLQEVCDGLVDVCGQHEHQSLLKESNQMDLIDRFANTLEERTQFAGILTGLQGLEKEIEVLHSTRDESLKRQDFVRFQYDELKAAQLTPQEDETLAEEKRLLASGHQRVSLARQIKASLLGQDGDEGLSVRACCQVALQKARALLALDPKAVEWVGTLESIVAETQTLEHEVDRYLGQADDSDERLAWVQERLALIASLKRKYGATVEEMLQKQESLRAELETTANFDERIGDLESKRAELRTKVWEQGQKLSMKRKKMSKTLGQEVTKELADLNMQGSVFTPQLTDIAEMSDWGKQVGPNRVDFLIRTNLGDEPKPIEKIASGGELSRVTLAIRRVIADRGGIGVYLFDEIDTGMGGQTAHQVGKKLKSVAKFNQVLCITHLPQVAAFADHHLVVQKSVKANKTTTQVQVLDADQRVQEIARMLGGSKTTQATLRNAKDLLDQANP